MKSLFRAVLFLFAFAAVDLRSDTLEQVWRLAPGDRTYLTTDNTQRGLAYNPATGHLLLVNRAGGLSIYILDAATGEEITVEGGGPKLLDVTGISGGTFAASMIGITDDGVIYAANLTTGSLTTPFKVYRWANEDAAPTIAYEGDPGNGDSGADRWGDSFDVRGSGLTTQLLAGTSDTSAKVAVFTTTDGENFTHTSIAGAATAAGTISVAFGEGNTIWTKRPNAVLRHVSFDLASGTATQLHTFTQAPVASIGFSGKYYGAIAVETPDHGRVYDVSDLASGPILVGQLDFAADNANANAVGAVDFGGTNVFFLDTNNGLLAARIVAGATPVTIQTQPATTTVIETGVISLSVAAQGTPPLQYQWTHAGTNIPGATSATLTLTNVPLDAAGEYQVTVSNAAGPVPSAVATLTVTPIVKGDNLTVRWRIRPGERTWIADDNSTRGVAINKVTGNVLVVSRTGLAAGQTGQIVVIDGGTGTNKHVLNVDPTIVTGGFFPLNMVGVADDGAVYACNLTTGSTATPFAVYRWASDAADAVPELVYLGDPSGGGDVRFGDSFDVRGAGDTTQILAGSRNGNNVAIIFPNSNPELFAATAVSVPDAPTGAFGLGVAFGEGNSFYGDSSGAVTRLVTYDDPTVGGLVNGTIARAYTAAEIPTAVGAVSFDPASKMLAGLAFENPDNVRLYKISADVTEAPTLVDQEVFDVDNANINGTASADFGTNNLVVLDTNNGIIMFDFTPAATQQQQPNFGAPQIAANGNVTSTLTGRAGDTFMVQAANDLTAPISWNNVGNVTIGANGTATITDTSASGQAMRFYRAVSAPTP
jgi:hypothetical protein